MSKQLPQLELPTWLQESLAELTEAELANYYQWPTLARAQAEVAADRVLSLRVIDHQYDGHQESLKIRADVLGRGRLLVCNITFQKPLNITSECTCRNHSQCEHGAAVALVLKQAENGRTKANDWRPSIAALVKRHQKRPPQKTSKTLVLNLKETEEDYAFTIGITQAEHRQTALPFVTWKMLTEEASGIRKATYPQKQLNALLALTQSAQARGFKYGTYLPVSTLRGGIAEHLTACLKSGIQLQVEQENYQLAESHPELQLQVKTKTDQSLEITLKPELINPQNYEERKAENLTPLDRHGVFSIDRKEKLLYLNDTQNSWPTSAALLGEHLTIPAADRTEFEITLLKNFPPELPIISDGSWKIPEKLYRGWEFDAPAPLSEAQLEGREKAYVRAQRVIGTNPEKLLPDEPTPNEEAELRAPWLKIVKAAGLDLQNHLDPELPISWLDFSENYPKIKAEIEQQGEICVLGKNLQDYPIVPLTPQINCQLNPAENDWFDLKVSIEIGKTEIPLPKIITALVRHQRYLRVKGAGLIDLRAPIFARLKEALEAADALLENQDGEANESIALNRYQLENLDTFEELITDPIAIRNWKTHLRNLNDHHIPNPPEAEYPLRNYQKQGYEWLYYRAQNQLGGILADDMGLGKTLQVLTMIASQQAHNPQHGPVLIVAPTSLLNTWANETQKFYPHLKTRILAQTPKKNPEAYQDANQADLLITSYGLLRLSAEYHQEQNYAGIILDEAQAVKNPNSVAHKTIRSLPKKWCFAITGTPIENTVMDLWSLLKLTCPGLLPRIDIFRAAYARPIDQASDTYALNKLNQRVKPFLLRRTKQAVAADLPDKTEQTLTIPLNTAHKRIYDRYLAKERKRILGLLDDMKANRFAILRALTKLRQLALDPALLDPEDDEIGSAKIDFLIEELQTIIADGHQALVFSQFTSYLKRVQMALQKAGIDYAYLDGSTSNRGQIIDDFKAGKQPVFLISLKAGGVGLTLTEADYVYLLDPWWNPAAEAQAVDRAHRIGQDKKVNVYRLISEQTIEERVLQLQARKLGIIAAVTEAAEVDAEAQPTTSNSAAPGTTKSSAGITQNTATEKTTLQLTPEDLKILLGE
ncbi:hypothetical protein BSR29_04145 [Boudabousia liubingyangii]|uniref:DEAD/DEAH box helicase n=1 Tax=Boudabousia liubingyangii TaxID=1921764 RepID=A0A1Q5PNC2_9ACTO|nr:DEAD/DEAH box helicase [Boudabousia liubingyangii]OKL49033.1 hypothetical protein BSR29_04145 [Boudabousia liubingyangii]